MVSIVVVILVECVLLMSTVVTIGLDQPLADHGFTDIIVKNGDLQNPITPGTISRRMVGIASDGLGRMVAIPIITIKGYRSGPTIALTAAIHGDEVTGIPILFDLIDRIDAGRLAGTIIVAPVLNPEGVLMGTRGDLNGKDLNRMFNDGKGGTSWEQIYASGVLEIMRALKCTHHVDFHTATSAYDNSYYIRVDLNHAQSVSIAQAMAPQMILNTTGPEQSFRRSMIRLGVPSVTVEIGGPARVDASMRADGHESLDRLLAALLMIDGNATPAQHDTVVLESSQWMYTEVGGILDLVPNVATLVKKGDIIGQTRSLLGQVIATYRAPFGGFVIGRVAKVACSAGTRFVHLGRPVVPAQ